MRFKKTDFGSSLEFVGAANLGRLMSNHLPTQYILESDIYIYIVYLTRMAMSYI